MKGTLLLISMYFLPEPGGGASAALNRATILKMIGYNVFILCGFPTYPNGKIIEPKYHKKFVYVETIQNITVIRLRLLQIKHEGYIKRFILFSNFVIVSILLMPKILKITGKIDIVYSLAPIIFSSFSGFIYSKLTNAFFIYDVPDLWPEELVAFKSTFSPLITVIGKIIAKLSYSLPDIIITISNSAAKIIYDNYKPRPPIYVIPIGVNPSLFPKLLKKESRTNLINQKIFPKELQEKFIILYAGLISPAQEVENLIILAEKIKDIHDIQVVILGDGENKPKIAKKIQSMNNVHLLNYQPRNMMPLIYSSVDIGTVL
jgi:colanic acid biosynthesis glycosyl transferase WcaI